MTPLEIFLLITTGLSIAFGLFKAFEARVFKLEADKDHISLRDFANQLDRSLTELTKENAFLKSKLSRKHQKRVKGRFA